MSGFYLIETPTETIIRVSVPLFRRARMYQDHWYIIKIFRREGVVDGEGDSSEGCLKWGGGGH